MKEILILIDQIIKQIISNGVLDTSTVKKVILLADTHRLVANFAECLS